MNPYDFIDAQDLLEECKRRYPIGSYFRCASVSTDICLVEKSTYDDLRYDEDDNYYSGDAYVDVSEVGTLTVDFGLRVFIINDNERNTGYMVRNNKWAEPCDHNGDLYVDIPRTQSSGFKFNIGDTVKVCNSDEDTTKYGYVNRDGVFQRIDAVGGKEGTIIGTKLFPGKGVYFSMTKIGEGAYIHQDRLTLLKPIMIFNNGDIVVVCKKEDDPTDYGYWNPRTGFAKINGVGDSQGTIKNSINGEHGIYYQIDSLGGSDYIHEARLKLVISIQSQSNTTKNGKEHTARSGTESAKVCRPNQQISESAPIRGVGLKGSGSKIRLGGDNRHH